MTAWICLVMAALCQVAWTFSLKFLDLKNLQAVHWSALFAVKGGLYALLPLLGYILFGLLNSYFLSVAMKHIPASTTIAVWLGLAVVGIKAADMTFFKGTLEPGQLLYILLILAGVIGLKTTSRL